MLAHLASVDTDTGTARISDRCRSRRSGSAPPPRSNDRSVIMKHTIDSWIRGTAVLLLLAGATACSTPGDGDGGGGGGDASPTVSIDTPADGATFASGAS